MNIARRRLLGAVGGAGLLGLATAPFSPGLAAPFIPPAGPRHRVLYLNDLAGDIDGLFATVHMILSPSVDLRGIVGTCGDMGGSARQAKALADEILATMGLTGRIKTYEGADHMLRQPGTPLPSPGARAIVDEALRTDTTLPLIVAVGGGLTEVASALLMEPRIAGRFTLAWIGGGKPHPEGARLEPNFSIDPLAAQHVFNETSVPIWQVPSDVYQTCVVSDAELNVFVRPCGAIGEWLYRQVVETAEKYKPYFNPGATWSLGDNPLVVLAALNDWVPSVGGGGKGPFAYQRTGSSHFSEVFAPRLDTQGTATPRDEGRKIRVYRDIDNRLMFGDFFAKLRENAPER